MNSPFPIHSAVGVRVAMWSGPRNISTAMMRSWGSRKDCFVTDEPLYACFLKQTGAPHPGAEEVIAAGETDWRRVTAWLVGPIPNAKAVWFQKHMTHHLLPEIEMDWLKPLRNCFLIRDPREMVPSLLAVTPGAELADTGLPQQARIFEWVRRETGLVPPVVDARDVLENPAGMLRALCENMLLPFSESMLRWLPGPRETDGIWAKHWYGNVEKSTGFEPYQLKRRSVPESKRGLLEASLAVYQALHSHRIAPR